MDEWIIIFTFSALGTFQGREHTEVLKNHLHSMACGKLTPLKAPPSSTVQCRASRFCLAKEYECALLT